MPVTQHFQYLDGWRGLAIASLLVGHFFPVPGINLGTFGVNLFFVLSGLLMSRLLFEKSVPLDEFYRRRIARIFPAALAFIALLVFGYLIAGRKVDWLDVAAAATFTNNYFEGTTGPWRMPLGHLWSLSVEEHSYIILSLVAVAARRKLADPKILVISATAVIALFGIHYQLFSDPANMARLSLHTEVAGFGIFASAALFLCMRHRDKPALSGWVFIGLLAVSIATHWWFVPAPVRIIVGVGALAIAVNFLASAPAWIHAVLSIAPLRQLGLWSFSLYIWQQPFYMYYRYYGMDRLVGFGLALACGIASFYLIEQPSRRFLNERWGRKPGAVPQALQPGVASNTDRVEITTSRSRHTV